MIGSRLGPYEITAKLGEGGMGQVFQAKDFHLGRNVALKVLPEGFTQDAERLARFEREAKLLAQLNHPNIAQIYGLEVSGDTRALVMELVEGPTLAERLEHGPLPFNECLSISLQIAHALEEAHEKGIVHRDLKPQNIKASMEGKVKVLDFGLAKAMDPVSPGSVSASRLAMSPTLTLGGTAQGVILGTAAYMAPEQARGAVVDKRADIWAFGVVLYEMLSGERLFEEGSVVDTLSAVMRKEIEFERLPVSTPRRLRELLRRCLERNPRNRLHDIADARLELEEAIARPEDLAGANAAVLGAPVAPKAKRATSAWAWVSFALAAAVVALLWIRPLRAGAPAAPAKTSRLTWSLPEGITPVPLEESSPLVAISPDGTTLAAAVLNESGEQVLYVRSLDSLESRELSGTEGASEPIFSPDGRSIAFFAGGELKKTAVAGGAVVRIASASDSRGGAWAADGTLLYSPVPESGLMRVAETGGTPRALTTPNKDRGERTHRWPDVLPGAKTALFTVGRLDSPDNYDDARIEAVELATGARHPVMEGASAARYLAATGELIYGRAGALYAVPFDPERLLLRGKPRLVLEDVGSDVTSGAVHVALSPDGTLVYLASESPAAESRLAWVAESGATEPVPAPARSYWAWRVSPDGTRLAALLSTRVVGEIWLVDLRLGTLTKLSGDDLCYPPVWSPDGRFVFYTRRVADGSEIVRRPANGGDAERLATLPNASSYLQSFSRDGTRLFFEQQTATKASDVFVLSLSGERRVEAILSSPEDQYFAVPSPDGRWLAYVSQEGGRGEVYVMPYLGSGAGPGVARQVSLSGGSEPHWSRDGRTLFFRASSGLAKVAAGAGPGLELGSPVPIERVRFGPRRSNYSYDLAPDGRFLIVMPGARAQRPEIAVVLDWASELRRLLARGGR